MKLTKVAVILVNYNNPSDTKKSIFSVKKVSPKNCLVKIFVVNNGCTDGESNLLSEDCPEIILINSQRNLGFGAGNNLAAKEAIRLGFEYLLFLNNDAIIVSEDFFNKLLASPYNITSPMLESQINGERVLDYGGKVDWLFGRNTHLSTPKKADYYSGACLFMKSEVFEAVSGFDEKYFLYYEDVDFCLRAAKHGFSLGLEKDAKVFHHLSATTNMLGVKKLKYLAVSHLRFCHTHLSSATFPLYKLFNLYLVSKRIFPHLKWQLQSVWSSTYQLRNSIYCYYFGIKTVHLIGDSHVWPYREVHPFVVHHLGGATAYNLDNINSKTGSHRLLKILLSSIPQKNSTLLFSLGEIDCRLHIYYQYKKNNHKKSLNTLIANTVKKYLGVLISLKNNGWVVSVLSPTPAGDERNIYKMPYFANFKTRAKITKKFHLLLKEECKKNNIPYIDVYSKIATNYGGIMIKYKQDAVHLNKNVVPITTSLLSKSIYNKN